MSANRAAYHLLRALELCRGASLRTRQMVARAIAAFVDWVGAQPAPA